MAQSPLRYVVTLTLLGVVLGCGNSKGKLPGARLEGKVTLDGNPIENGNLRFIPTEAGHGEPVIVPVKDGHYVASSVPVGKLQVIVSANKKTGRMIQVYSQQQEEEVNIIPAKYNAGIPIEVTQDNPSQNFELDSR